LARTDVEGVRGGFELGEVDGAVVLVDLDGVAAAEGDVGALVAGEVGKMRWPQTSQSGRGVEVLISERVCWSRGRRRGGCGAWLRAGR
jgi:hypothetical protein